MGDSCSQGTIHVPAHLTLEQHHVIPVAWQLLWQPPVAPFPGVDPDGRGRLWDARTAAACPTHHRNIHYWIVKMMHACTGEDPLQAKLAVKGRGTQFATGYLALCRWKEAGGSLQQLVAAHEWGMA